MESENSPTLVEVTESENQSTQRRLWCFTLFCPDSLEGLVLPEELPATMSYLHFQREVCPTTQRHHLQGFLRYNTKVRFRQAKTRLQAAFRTTLSPRLSYTYSTVEANIRYCSKVASRLAGTSPTILGSPPANESNGKPNSTPKIIECLVKKMSPLDALLDEDVDMSVKTYGLRYAKTWNYLLASMVEDRSILIDPTVIVFYGIPRSGKTRLASEMFPNAYIKPTGKWWEHYTGQTEVIYDDFDGSSMCFTDWKHVVDRYRMLVENKGGSSKLASTVHIITTNVYPSHWWSKKVTGQDGRDAIWGRFTQLWHFWSLTHPARVYDDPSQFRALPENFSLEQEDPKARPE